MTKADMELVLTLANLERHYVKRSTPTGKKLWCTCGLLIQGTNARAASLGYLRHAGLMQPLTQVTS